MSGFWQKGESVKRMDWIASTEDVRAMWNLSQSDEAAFERWLALYGAEKFTAGAKSERERIIKLLEEHMPNSSDHDFVGCECEYPTNNWYNSHIIALIKGEQK